MGHLMYDVACVDVCTLRKAFPGVAHVHKDGLEYLRSSDAVSAGVSRITMMGMIHLLGKKMPDALRAAHQALPPSGIVVVQTRGKHCCWPLPPDLKRSFADNAPSVDEIAAAAESAGFTVQVEWRTYEAALPLSLYERMIDIRWITTLEGISDAQMGECKDYGAIAAARADGRVHLSDRLALIVLKKQ